MADASWKTYAAIFAIGGGFLANAAYTASARGDNPYGVTRLQSPAPINVTELVSLEQLDQATLAGLRDGMMTPHFFKISGIAETLQAHGATLDPALELRVAYASKVAEAKYESYQDNEGMLMSYDMARSEGELEAREGEWTVDALESYVDRVIAMDQRFLDVTQAARAYLMDEGMSEKDAEGYVQRSIAISLFDYLQPGHNAISGPDERMNIRDAGHAGVVNDLHQKMHAFFLYRLEDLDMADQVFRVTQDGQIETPAADRDATPGMDM